MGGDPPKRKGGEAIDISAGAGVGSGGVISEKGLINAFKRAKQSGSFIVQNQGLTKFPEELCEFATYQIPDENWWDGQDLTRIDVSLNKIEEIPSSLFSDQNKDSLNHLNISGNQLKGLPDTLFKLEALKFLDISNN